MKKETKEVKSQQKVIGKVEIPVYESIKEATDALKPEKALSLINRQNASDIMNEFRAAQTRTSSPAAQLTRMAKSNPELEKVIEQLVEKYQPK